MDEKLRILLCEDDENLGMLLREYLQAKGYSAELYPDGEAGYKAFLKNKYDLCVFDVMMPKKDGFTLAQEVRAANAEIPIIFLTALNSTTDIVKGFQVGANDFISKPFNKEELIIRVTHQISLVAAKRIILNKTEELQRTIAGRDKLYSVIAHDLRSPMGSIKMVLNMLILNLPAEKIGDEMYELLTMANQTTEDVFSLLDNLLKWTKSQIGKLKVVYQNIDTAEIFMNLFHYFCSIFKIGSIRRISFGFHTHCFDFFCCILCILIDNKICKCNICSFRSKFQSNSFTNTTSRTGHNGCFSI